MSQTKPARARGGRPPVPIEERLSVPLNTWTTQDLSDQIDREYHDSGMRSRSEYIRAKLSGEAISAGLRRADPQLLLAIGQLSEQVRIIGDHYNQDLKYKHLGRTVVDTDGHIERLLGETLGRLGEFIDQQVTGDDS